MINDFFERLEILIATKKIKKKDLAALIGVDQRSVSRWKRSPPSVENMLKISEKIGCSYEWLSKGKGKMFTEVQLATIGKNFLHGRREEDRVTMTQNIGKVTGRVQQIKGDVHGDISFDISRAIGRRKEESRLAELRPIPVLNRIPADSPLTVEENIETYIPLPGAPPDSFALRMPDESMAPHLIRDDYVIFVINRQARPGDIVVANDDYGDSIVKRLKAKGDDLFLVSDNPVYPSYPVNESYRIMGVVIGGWRQLKI